MQKISNLLNIVTAASPYWLQYNYNTMEIFNETGQNAQNTGETGRLFPGHILEECKVINPMLPAKFGSDVPVVRNVRCTHVFADLMYYKNDADFVDLHVLEYEQKIFDKANELLFNATMHGKDYGVTVKKIYTPNFLSNIGGNRMVFMVIDVDWQVRECVEIVKYNGMAAPSDIGSVDFERVGIT